MCAELKSEMAHKALNLSPFCSGPEKVNELSCEVGSFRFQIMGVEEHRIHRLRR